MTQREQNYTFCLLLSSNFENATLCLLSRRLVQHFISFKFSIFFLQSRNPHGMKEKKKTPEILHEISDFFLPADLCLSFIFHFMNFYKYLNCGIVLKNHRSSDAFEMKTKYTVKAKFTSPSFQLNARCDWCWKRLLQGNTSLIARLDTRSTEINGTNWCA